MFDPYTILLAPNPSMMTGPGTNTIILGGGSDGATVIDPADEHAGHLDAIVQAGEGRGGIRRILLTHGHPDHIGGAATLRERLGVPIFAFDRRTVPMADEEIPDEAVFPVGDDMLQALYTPGHSPDHLCYLLQRRRILFAGDLISGITTNVVGDMFDYLNSLKRLQGIEIAEIVPAHGPTIQDAQAKLADYIAHRLQREAQIIHVLHIMPSGILIPDIVKYIYVDIDEKLHLAAAHSVKAHLLKLEREDRVRRDEQERWSLKEQY